MLKNQSKLSQDDQTYLNSQKDLLSTALKSSGFLRAGLAAAPFVGAAVSLLDFFIGGGKKDVPVNQEVKLSPLALNMSINLSGTISDSSFYHSVLFSTPGSNNLSLPLNTYPYYNETMGVFNLLNKPIVKRFYMYRNIDENGDLYQQTQIQLLSPITYVLNPASGLEINTVNGEPDIQFAYVVAGYDNYGGDPTARPGDFFEYEGFDQKTSLFQYRTPFYPIAELSTFVQGFENHDSYPTSFTALSYYIKFLINFKRTNSPGTSQNILFVAKYPLSQVYQPNALSNGSALFSGAAFVQAGSSEVSSFCYSAPYINTFINGGHMNAIDPRNDSLKVTMEQENDQSLVKVFPNPVKNVMHIKFRVDKKNAVTIRLTDAAGRIVSPMINYKQLEKGAYTRDITISSLSGGTYFLITNIGDKTISQTVIKQ